MSISLTAFLAVRTTVLRAGAAIRGWREVALNLSVAVALFAGAAFLLIPETAEACGHCYLLCCSWHGTHWDCYICGCALCI